MGRYCPKFGSGGYAQRQFVEVAAETATGKSSLSENFTREAERKGQFVTFLISEEPAFHRWERLGIHPSHHLILPTYEDATDGKDKKRMAAEPRMADALEAIKSPNCAGLVVDSAKAMVGLMQLFEKGKEKQGKKEFGSRLVAPRANFFEEFFNQIKEANNVAVIMILNHLYSSIGMDFRTDKEARKQTPGGNRLHFESYTRIAIKSRRLLHPKHHLIDKYKPQYGMHQYFDVYKNRWSPTWGSRQCEAKFYFKRDPYLLSPSEYDNEETAFKYGVYLGIIEAKKSEKLKVVGYNIDGKWFKGREEALLHLIKNYDLAYDIYLQLMKRHEEIFAPSDDDVKKTRASMSRKVTDTGRIDVEDTDDDEEEEEDDD